MTPDTAPYHIIISSIYLSYTVIYINNIPSPVYDHTFQLASAPYTSHLSSMTYPAVYGGDPPPTFSSAANNDNDDVIHPKGDQTQ
jgi:hypothetical protein